MPRGFSEREKEIIRNKLIQKGQDLFAVHGIKRTNIEELTQAVGISKGAFYLFFNSKEELFFAIIEQFEADFRKEVMANLAIASDDPNENFKVIMQKAFAAWRNNPLLKNFGPEEYQILQRKLPEDLVREHLNSDNDFIVQILDCLKAQSLGITVDPKLAAGLMKALFYVSLHEDEIGNDVYPKTLDVLIDLVADYLIPK